MVHNCNRRSAPRKTQIVPIEMIAPILAMETFRDHVRNKHVILLTDAEAVKGSLTLVKGCSSEEDFCELIELSSRSLRWVPWNS